ncbi:MAG: hypothetical protein KBD56_00010 [Candidatus Eisenbacteria bacterium]|nr:hypothetical protein [Candidatus Eisenbacteria bacterium]
MRAASVVVLLTLWFSLAASSAVAQQSTTGPVPPPGTDRGWRAENRTQVVLGEVPAYLWHHGCGPTALGMVIGYWDDHGFPDLVPGSSSSQTPAVDAMIADDSGHPSCALPDGDHYQDYACPLDDSGGALLPDRSQTGGAHESNCVADFMRTSWSSRGNYYGWSWDTDVAPAFHAYVRKVSNYLPTSTTAQYDAFPWMSYMAQIDAGWPVVLLVDTDADGNTDHFVTAVGYESTTQYYAVHDTWDRKLHWYKWRRIQAGRAWGVYSATVCQLGYSTGACCIGTACTMLSEANCAAAGGLWQGGLVDCTANPCLPSSAPEAGRPVEAESPRNTRASALSLRCHPNPVVAGTRIVAVFETACGAGSPSALPPAVLDVFDVSGRRLCTLTPDRSEIFSQEFSWSGRDEHGSLLPSGMYLLSVRAGRLQTTHWISMIR